MGMMDKVKFWKDDDDFDLDAELPPLDDPVRDSDGFKRPEKNYSDPGPSGFNHQQDLGSMQQNYPQPQPFQIGGDVTRDLQLISSKLDAIKSELDSMDQRLRKIESIAEREMAKTKTPGRDPWVNYE